MALNRNLMYTDCYSLLVKPENVPDLTFLELVLLR